MMDTQTEARIYLADGRGTVESAGYRRYHTFNAETYRAEGREPYGPLELLSDDALLAGASLTSRVDDPTDILLLPLTGGLAYQTEAAGTGFLEPGQLGVLALGAGDACTVSNPYDTETISLLQLGLRAAPRPGRPALTVHTFDLTQPNQLLPLLGTDSPTQVYIGRYGGRQDTTYQLRPAAGRSGQVFVFVLQGAFEVANRLLHARDGLSLTRPPDGEVPFEALSEGAMLLLLDLAC